MSDERIVDEIAGAVGDTFIDWRTTPPVDQWERILALLDAADFKVYHPNKNQSVVIDDIGEAAPVLHVSGVAGAKPGTYRLVPVKPPKGKA